MTEFEDLARRVHFIYHVGLAVGSGWVAFARTQEGLITDMWSDA